MKTILILIVSHFTWAHTISTSCKDVLKRQIWPLDCLLEAKIQRTPSHHLNQWCLIHHRKLMETPAPPSFIKLDPPPQCKKAALQSQKYFQVLNLITPPDRL